VAESGNAPLVDFYKSRVYDIGELIGIPKFVSERPPSIQPMAQIRYTLILVRFLLV